jgi:hypothetical protein
MFYACQYSNLSLVEEVISLATRVRDLTHAPTTIRISQSYLFQRFYNASPREHTLHRGASAGRALVAR